MDSTEEAVKDELNTSTSTVSEDQFPDLASDEEDKPMVADAGKGKQKAGEHTNNDQDAPKPKQKKDDAADDGDEKNASALKDEDLTDLDFSDDGDDGTEQVQEPKPKPATSKPVAKAKRGRKPKVDLDSGLVGPLDSGVAEQVKATGGRRERKQVQHFIGESNEKKPFAIEPGTGTKLADIPFIAEQINDKKRKAEDLRILHKICFDRPGTKIDIKKNVKQFSGFSFLANSDEAKKKRERMIKYKGAELKVACSVLGIKQNTVEKMVDDILEFCLKPEDTGRKPKLSSSPTKRSSTSKKHSPKGTKASSPKGKKTKRSSSDEESDEDAPPKKRSRVREGPTRNSSVGKKYKDLSEEEMEAEEVTSSPPTKSDSDQGDSEDEKQVKGKRRAAAAKPKKPKAKPKVILPRKSSNGTKPTPKKGKGASKSKPPPAKDDSDSEKDEDPDTRDSDEDEGEKDKGDAAISDKELTNSIKKIVKASDLRHVTMKMILDKVFEEYPDHGDDLQSRRGFIKSIVRKMI